MVGRGPLRAEFRKCSRRILPDAPFGLDFEVAEAYRLFPELKGDTYFIDAATGRLVHPRATKKMAERVEGIPGYRKKLEACRREKRSQFYKHADRPRPNVVLLYLEADSPSVRACPAAYSEGQRRRAVFDHELMHALSLRLKRDVALYGFHELARETMAENFSLVRQFQRYGNDNGKIGEGRLVAQAAAYMVFGDDDNATYFAAPSMEKVIELRKGFDMARLTPRETVAFARNISLRHLPAPGEIEEIRSELKHMKGMNGIESLAVRLMKTRSPLAFKWGALALRHAMSEDFAHEGKVAEFREKYWPKVEGEIKAREREFGLAA